MSKVRATFETPDLAIADRVQELAIMLLDMGVELEHIKISAPLYVDGKEISSVSGVRVKHIIYEHDATHWLAAKSKSGDKE